MKTIETLFLRAKHWQLFLLFVGVFGLGEMVAGGDNDRKCFIVWAGGNGRPCVGRHHGSGYALFYGLVLGNGDVSKFNQSTIAKAKAGLFSVCPYLPCSLCFLGRAIFS